MNFLLHPEADAEFAEAARYDSQVSPELGVRFYREMERLLREVCAGPERFGKFNPPARLHLPETSVLTNVLLEFHDNETASLFVKARST